MIDHENREDELYLTKAQLIEAQDVAELIEVVKLLQEQVNDLRWRMNQVCNFLSIAEREDE